MKNTLIVLVHPNFGESRANKALVEVLKGDENVTIHNLYETYPSYKIDVRKEQELLEQYDNIVFQFPFYRYGSPALLKEWIDVVLTTDFAYENTHKLKGKKFLVATTAGVGEETYKEGGTMVEGFLKIYEALSDDILVDYQKPFVIYDSMEIKGEELKERADNYREYLQALNN